ncbi:hypothetical protein EVAR_59877_1 [Eumeta japonica]|uniref:Uncharacterized protein n=1 Tax=Eumeta variegata TaxID=151549 RepID=A0A4C1XLS1_EUMVA|nr:hypothetical protein EVAR_59877_1 [Eumeta japonica]
MVAAAHGIAGSSHGIKLHNVPKFIVERAASARRLIRRDGRPRNLWDDLGILGWQRAPLDMRGNYVESGIRNKCAYTPDILLLVPGHVISTPRGRGLTAVVADKGDARSQDEGLIRIGSNAAGTADETYPRPEIHGHIHD